MNRTACFIIGLLSASGVLGISSRVYGAGRVEVTARDLAQLSALPFHHGCDPCDPRYDAIIKRGLTVVPDLIDLLDDPTLTDHPVCLFGGQYAIGDIAMGTISDIVVGVPWLEFITRRDDPRIEEIGFGVYWAYVRDSPENRKVVKRKAAAWFRESAGSLVWRPEPRHPAGGVYVARDTVQWRRDG